MRLKRRNSKSRLDGRECALVFAVYMTVSVILMSRRTTDYPSRLEEKDFDHVTDSEAIEFLQQLHRNVIFIEPFHGLGNRLRAYACAAAVAKLSNRRLIVVWIPDAHLNTSFSALFDTTNLTVIDYPVSHLVSKVWPDIKHYDYNVKGGKDKVLEDTGDAPIYVRSAYVLQSRTRVGESHISEQINSLVPSEDVKKITTQLRVRLGNADAENLVGIHIRMVADIEKDVPGIELITNDHPASASHMGPVIRERGKCHYKAFLPHIEEFIRRNPGVQFFVASDSVQAIRALRTRYRDRIISNDVESLERCESHLRRTRSCLQLSLAEFLVVGKESSFLILSAWSSASELIVRFGRNRVPHKYGCSNERSWFPKM